MNIKAAALAAILGLSVPTITTIVTNTPAVAAPRFPNGTFTDNTWSVSVWLENNSLRYRGQNLRTGDSIALSGATVSGNNQRRIYTWRNGPTRYQVSWRPSDPDFIRVQVFAPNGKEVLNRLLTSVYD
jgi:hypothetical protein